MKARVDQAKPGEWVTGRGWIETHWQPPVFPTRWDLDKVAPNNPVILGRADGHGAVANSAALKIAGIDKDTPNPFGGEISKDKQAASRTACCSTPRRDSFAVAFRRHYGRGCRTRSRARRETQHRARLDADPGRGRQLSRKSSIFKKLYAEGKIKLRIYKAVHGPAPKRRVCSTKAQPSARLDNRFTVRTIKVVSDGALGSRGAALLGPYSDAPTLPGF